MSAVLRSMQAMAAGAMLWMGCAAAAETVTIPPDLWDRPRSARSVLGHPAVQQAVRDYLGGAGRRLVIHHAPEQEPLMYAEEMRSWLIALAVNAADITLRADRNRTEPLTLEVIR